METFRQHAQEYQLHTCQHCEKFIVDTAKAANSTNRETSLGSFHIPGAQVFTAATNTCGLFQACIVTLKNDLTRRLLVDAVTEETACQFTLVVTLWYIRRADGGHGMTLEGAWRRDEPRGWLTDGVTRFNLWPRKDAPTMDRFTSHVVQPAVSSSKSFSKMQTSLNECLSSHAKYSPIWAALSYCWGGPQKAQTTSQNVNERYQAIDLGEMPLTLRDAIRTCRELNLPYLWIDSMCIIQDDEDDKAREINKMPEVYQGALVTLSASCSTTCHGGFLHDRLHPAPGVALPMRCSEGVYDIIQAVKWRPAVGEPIDMRAWTFQEQALSERIIDYGSQRASYFCNSSGKKQRFGMLPPPTDDLLRQEWAHTVEKYSARQLTFANDRLNALAAVASRFSKAAGLSTSEYVAGLWKPSLIRGLLWSVKAGQRRTKPTGGPSFSWASHLMEVEWRPEMWERDTRRETACVLEIEVVVSNSLLPLGSVASSRLTINGPLVYTTLSFPSGAALILHDDGGQHSVRLILDNEDETNASLSSVWLLELLFKVGRETIMGPGPDTRFGLVLRATKHGQFTRIGIYSEWVPQDIPVASHKPRNDVCERCKEIFHAKVSRVELV
ncbi:HET domain-containing protein [Fusarium keratoplasticum]|uniref:HET domain-containing protein n=1 Tax=Fusarium keratoplasticum TaxID=1328300 RepID=A0ACC0QGP9_9HYPO|nr:HET domain-containing protein [Fusarium keratoplasticum]KAI8652515.1 HET domain-containing protein [Fusarium keratoplasticum]